ncbi:MAG: hypothetical protein KCCBMMGE_00462 [Candidatus Methanoperedenaceae archaeon GB37]|nr:MAG: hypothetical protein KCCBMMGE_00462 [Candidatus Methanoperedenaceae archaeon GB37]
MAKLNPFEVAQKQLDECVKILKLDPDAHATPSSSNAGTSRIVAGPYG